MIIDQENKEGDKPSQILSYAWKALSHFQMKKVQFPQNFKMFGLNNLTSLPQQGGIIETIWCGL